ncbi:MAG: glycosyltransferase family 2 protein [Pseudomonadota bacterium]
MIIGVLAALHLVGAVILLVLSLWLFIEVVASFLPSNATKGWDEPGPIAAVVPAHNEGKGLIPTIKDIQAQLRPVDRLIVVADNCDDNTADIARAQGAEVLVRDDRSRRGKGYALQFALDHLRDAPPATVFFTDADCLHSEGLVTGVSAEAQHRQAPVQALYVMDADDNAPPSRLVAAFAWRLINDVRMRGLMRIAGTTRLVGAGAAFPWSIAQSLTLGSGEIVEDLALTVTLAAEGQKVWYAPKHLVSSTFPQDEAAAKVQRARWEHGSIGVIRQRIGRLLWSGVTNFAPWRVALALDVAVPPLTVLGAATTLAVASGLVLGILGAWPGFVISVMAFVVLISAVMLFWITRGRAILPLSKAPAFPAFALSKLGVYGKSGRESSAEWTRTPRNGEKS